MIQETYNLITAVIDNPDNKVIHLKVIKDMIEKFWFDFQNHLLFFSLKRKEDLLINRIIG